MAEADVAAFLTHLANDRGVSASTQNQALAALLFLYRHVLCRELGALRGLVWAKRSEHVPVVLTRDEIVAVLAELIDPIGRHLDEVRRLHARDLADGFGRVSLRGVP